MSRRTSMLLLSAARAAIAGLAMVVVSGTAWAAGGPPATKLVNVADTRGLEPGLGLWVAEIYNDGFLLFGGVVVLVMVGMGVVLVFGFDRAMSLLGLDLGKLHHDE